MKWFLKFNQLIFIVNITIIIYRLTKNRRLFIKDEVKDLINIDRLVKRYK
jgi:hypothetical protein